MATPARWGLGRFGGLGVLLGVCLAIPTFKPVHAANLPLPEGAYTYTVIDQDLATALQEFGANHTLKVDVSPEVKGRIQGRIPEGSARDFLGRLAMGYSLEWYYDGAILYITTAKEHRTQLLVLNPISWDRLKSALDALDISDARFPIRAAPGKGVIMVSGPPRYVWLVEQTLASLVAEQQSRPRPEVKAEPPKGSEKPSESSDVDIPILTLYRGSQVTVIRAGRPERLIGPDPEPPQRPVIDPAFDYGRRGYPAGPFPR